MLTIGRTLLTLVGVITSTTCYLADFNATHVYNPTWPPHAKFHNGQTMSMGLLLGLCTLYYLYRSPIASSPVAIALSIKEQNAHPTRTKGVEKMGALRRREDLDTAALFASLYWITMLSGYVYPGAAALDPPGDPREWSVQIWAVMVNLGMVGVGWWLERRRLVSGI